MGHPANELPASRRRWVPGRLGGRDGAPGAVVAGEPGPGRRHRHRRPDGRSRGCRGAGARPGRVPPGRGVRPASPARRRYFDDNAWIGLELVRLHALSGDPSYLALARRVFAFVAGGQDADGGVRWVEGRSSRNACATAPASELALRLYLVEPDDALLGFARRAMDWLERTLRLASGLLADREDRGVVEPTVWSYNQGAALGAFALLLHDRGPGRGSRRRAHPGARLTRASPRRGSLGAAAGVQRRVVPQPGGPGGRRAGAGTRVALDDYLDRVWNEARDPRTGLFTRAGIGSYDGTPAIDHGD